MTRHIPLSVKDMTTTASIPAFVSAQIQKFAGGGAYEDYLYHERDVMLDLRTCMSFREQINMWLENYDKSAYFVHVGGSGLWICVGIHHTLLYDIIPASHLSTEPDRYTWWVIKAETRLDVYKIAVCKCFP